MHTATKLKVPTSSTPEFDLFQKDVTSFEIEGTPVILRSTKTFGEIVSMNITAPGGVKFTDKPGSLELLTTVIARGTKDFSKEEIDRIFSEKGAQFSVEARSDLVEVNLKCLKRFLPDLIKIISEMMAEATLSQEEVELARNQLLAELQQEKEHPDAILQLLSHKAFYAGHPYYNRPHGFLETVPKVTREDLASALKKIFNRKSLVFTFVGDFSEKEVREMVKNAFLEKLPKDGARLSPPNEPIHNKVNQLDFAKADSPTTYFMAKFKAPSLMDEDYPSLTIGTQILDSRLFDEVRTKRGLTYAVSASLGNSGVNSGSLYVSSTKLPQAVDVIFKELKKIQTKKVDAATIDLQIRKFISSWYLSRETSSSQARIFALYEIIGHGHQNASSFIERLQKVTPTTVQKAMQKYYKDFTYAVVGPKPVNLKSVLPK